MLAWGAVFDQLGGMRLRFAVMAVLLWPCGVGLRCGPGRAAMTRARQTW